MAKNLYLITGEEEFLVSQAIRDIAGAARASDPECDVTMQPASELDAGELAQLCGPSLFAQRRVVIITHASDASKALVDALVAQAQALSDDIVLVVAHSGGGKGKALLDRLRMAGATERRCAKVTKYRDKLAFVRDEIAAAGGRCLAGAAELIVDIVGGDLRELATVCRQLVADAGSTIDADVVRRYHRGQAEASGFTVADAVMNGDEAGALEALRWAAGMGISPVLIADALADGVRSVARVAAACGGARKHGAAACGGAGKHGAQSAYQLASSLGMPVWKVERAQRMARSWNSRSLAEAMQIAARVNADVKGVAQDRIFALEQAIVTLTAHRNLAAVKEL